MSVTRVLFAPGCSFVVFSKVTTAVLFSFVLVVVSPGSLAGPEVIPLAEINHTYTINTSMMDNLTALIGKRVTVFLDGGAIQAGIVKSVGADLVHMEKTKQNEVFDLLLQIESIQAIEVQSREY